MTARRADRPGAAAREATTGRPLPEKLGAARLPSLTSLDLSKCFLDFSKGTWGGSDELLPPPLQQIPRLTALDLAQCDALTDRVLAAI
mmetsp:Transcript_38051/g.97360  ORF Transcript_38051/g.97360 Transcript_38051/m.97360 type:complete len:88 (+) Transcript_38051:106-369(+)